MGNVNGNGNGQAPSGPSASEVLLGLYQQESYLRKQVDAINSQIKMIEGQKAEIYARMQNPQASPEDSDEDLKHNIRAGLDSIAALAGINQED